MPNESNTRVYRISPWRRGFFAGLGLLICLPLLFMGIVNREEAGFVGCAIVVAIWAPVYYIVRLQRLILSPQGVQIRQLGYRLESSWENVVRLWLLNGQAGFELAQPMENSSARWLAGTAGSEYLVQSAAVDPVPGEDRRGLVVARRFIPLDGFEYWVENGDLLDVIRGFAPHLVDAPLRRLEAVAESGEPQTEEPKAGNTSNILWGSFLVAAVIVGMLMGTNVLPFNVQWGLLQLIRLITLVCLAAYTVFNFSWSVKYARAGRWGRATLAVVVGLLQAAFCVALVCAE